MKTVLTWLYIVIMELLSIAVVLVFWLAVAAVFFYVYYEYQPFIFEWIRGE